MNIPATFRRPAIVVAVHLDGESQPNDRTQALLYSLTGKFIVGTARPWKSCHETNTH